MFSKKATKNDEIFTVDLTLCSNQFFVALLENTNFTNKITLVFIFVLLRIFPFDTHGKLGGFHTENFTLIFKSMALAITNCSEYKSKIFFMKTTKFTMWVKLQCVKLLGRNLCIKKLAELKQCKFVHNK